MRFVLFYHSLVSDWNHGNAHFVRGVVAELVARGHQVTVWEPADGWSPGNLRAEHGEEALAAFRAAFPGLESRFYPPGGPDLGPALDGADVVIAHERSAPELVARLGRRRAEGGRFRLFFHDTHHRAATEPATMARFELGGFDGVLAFGSVLRDLYLGRRWTRAAWTWHEAADTRSFGPRPGTARAGDLVWIGNWDDEERSAELVEFVIEPVRALRLKARAFGVRYPEAARAALAAAGIEYGGWLPNHEVPAVCAAHAVTVHVPRRPYARALPGIPTLRMFEALACGIPLVSAPWDDLEGLFAAGQDYLVARDGMEMRRQLRLLLHEPAWARAVAERGRRTILERHTCAHRVDELSEILREAGVPGAETALASAGANGAAVVPAPRPSAASAPIEVAAPPVARTHLRVTHRRAHGARPRPGPR
jgi:spore maturation protein CgeB